MPERRDARFPLVLTALVAGALSLLVGLGVWQLHRLEETNSNRAKLEALATAPATNAAVLFATAAPGLDHRRIAVDCGPAAKSAPLFRYAVRDGVIAWRVLTLCRLSGLAYDSVLLDRGVVGALTGAMAPRAVDLPTPGHVTGVLRGLGRKPFLENRMASGLATPEAVRVVDATVLAKLTGAGGLTKPAPYVLVVETEDPPVPGVFPAAVAEDIPRDNFGYALTWFGLAAGLAGVYGAMVFKRLFHP